MSEEPEKLAEGTLISHLLELRGRLIRALAAVGLFFIPCAYYSNQIFTFIAQPLLDKLPKGGTLIATGVMTPFTTPFKLSFFVALFIAMPYVLYQAWAFVGPGLYRREKRFAVPLMVSSVLLFYAGVTFAYVVRPLLLRLAGAAPEPLIALPVRVAFTYKKKKARREYVRVALRRAADGVLEAIKHPQEGAGVITSLTETDGFLELAEETTEIVPGTMAGFLSYQSLIN